MRQEAYQWMYQLKIMQDSIDKHNKSCKGR